MSNIGKILTSPYVLIGGGAIGLILLLAKSPQAAASTQTVGYSSAITSNVVALNTAALGAQSEQAAIRADLAKAQYAKDVALQATVVSYLKSVNDNNTRLSLERINSQAGIANTMIVQQNMLTMDIMNNNTRLSLGQQEIEKQRIISNASVEVAKQVASGQKVASIANAIGSVVGSAAKIAGG